MTRNLDHRLEVGFPILDPLIQLQIRDIIDLQLRDNTKARIIQPNGLSTHKKPKKNNIFRAQTDTYNYLKNL
jgi:polyphosphate kinase